MSRAGDGNRTRVLSLGSRQGPHIECDAEQGFRWSQATSVKAEGTGVDLCNPSLTAAIGTL